MVAETLTAARAAAGVQPFKAHGDGLVQVAYGSFAIAANVEDGDMFEMCKLPAGAVILGGHFYGGDLDTDSTETIDLDVGWAGNGGALTHDSADAAGLGDFGVLTGDIFALGNVSNEVGYSYPLAGVLIAGVFPKFSRATTIQVEANAVAATFAAKTISVVVYYTVDDSIVA